jgi:hypothetical protein
MDTFFSIGSAHPPALISAAQPLAIPELGVDQAAAEALHAVAA